MPFDSPPPPDPHNRPWIETLHLRPPHPDRCYLSESRWARKPQDQDPDDPARHHERTSRKRAR